jgi:hypothetical protein
LVRAAIEEIGLDPVPQITSIVLHLVHRAWFRTPC